MEKLLQSILKRKRKEDKIKSRPFDRYFDKKKK